MTAQALMTCVVCGKRVNVSGEFLYVNAAGESIGVCGKPKPCARKYNGEPS